MKTYHRFTYAAAIKAIDDLKPFQARDGVAFQELTAALPKSEYGYGSVIFNYPAELGITSITPDTLPLLTPNDILIMTTRAPTHDKAHGDKRRILESGTDLEKSVFESLRDYLAVCARSHVKLSESMAKQLLPGYEDLADMKFRQNRKAILYEHKTLEEFRFTELPEEHFTMAFFIHLPSIPRYKCGLIASFGMGGFETLIWNRIVRNHIVKDTDTDTTSKNSWLPWLKKPVFVVAKLNLEKIPVRPTTLDFVETVGVEIVLQHSIV